MEAIKNRYEFVFLFDVRDGNPNGDPDFDNMPRTDEETDQGLVSDVCIKRKVRNYIHLLKGLKTPYDIFIREGNILNPLIQEKRDEEELKAAAKYADLVEKCVANHETDSSVSEEQMKSLTEKIAAVRDAVSNKQSNAVGVVREKLDKAFKSILKENKWDGKEMNTANTAIEQNILKSGRLAMCAQYYDIRTFGAVMSTGEEKAEEKSTGEEKAEEESTGEEKVSEKKGKKKKANNKKRIKGLGVVRGPVQFVFARSIDPIFSKSNSITRCCVTKESDEDKNNTIGNKYTVSYGLYRMHGFISASDAAKTGFSEEDKKLLFQALINAFENDHSAARGEMNPRALIVFKHDSPLGNARAGQLFDLVQVKLTEGVEFPRSFGDYEVTVPSQKELDEKYPGVTVEVKI